MQTPSSPFDNHLLAGLTATEWSRLKPYADRVVLTRNQTIYDSGETLSHAYFPTTLLASLMYVTLDGDCVESALVGNEGMLGVSLVMSGGPMCGCATVLTTGEAYRIPAGVLRSEFIRAGSTMRMLLGFTQALLAQVAWFNRLRAGHQVGISRLRIGAVQIVHLPGEPFVEFQLFAQQTAPESFVCVAGYGECGVWYFGPDSIFSDRGGYEQTWSFTEPCQEAIEAVMTTLLKRRSKAKTR